MDLSGYQTVRGKKEAFSFPSHVPTVVDQAPTQTAEFSPFSNASCFSSDRNHTVVPGVSLLLRTGRPSAVRRGVRSSVSFPINGVVGRRSGPHVCEEVLERFTPTFADDDAAPAVKRKRCGSRVQASVFHAMPRSVLRRVVAPVLEAVHCTPRRCTGNPAFTSKTSATFGHAFAEGHQQFDCLDAAVASASDQTLPVFIPSSVVEDEETSVPMPCYFQTTHVSVLPYGEE